MKAVSRGFGSSLCSFESYDLFGMRRGLMRYQEVKLGVIAPRAAGAMAQWFECCFLL